MRCFARPTFVFIKKKEALSLHSTPPFVKPSKDYFLTSSKSASTTVSSAFEEASVASPCGCSPA